MFAIVFEERDIVDLTSDWESSLWFCGRLNELWAINGPDDSPKCQIYWVD
jgi:hypothetical protein